jgi:hypothetical protein
VTIHFCTVVGGTNVRLLSRLVRHYRHVGVDGRWFINVHMSDPDDEILHAVELALADHDIDVGLKVVGSWLHRVNPGIVAKVRSLYPSDWWVLADHDEFHEFPSHLTEVADFCAARGYHWVTGHFVDRLAPGGLLAPIRPTGSLWHQYPLGGRVTAVLTRADEPKVVLTRGHVFVGWGNHWAWSGIPSPRNVLDVPVHHFKWDASVVARLGTRYTLYERLDEPYRGESAAVLEHVKRHGRIDAEDPAFRTRYVGNPYGHDNLLD